MNVTAFVHFLAGLAGLGTSVPLIKKRVKMNPWYGIRVPEAFKSEAAWYELNRYGGWAFLWWGASVCLTALVGLFLPRRDWVAYDFVSLIPILGGLGIVMSRIRRHARRIGRDSLPKPDELRPDFT